MCRRLQMKSYKKSAVYNHLQREQLKHGAETEALSARALKYKNLVKRNYNYLKMNVNHLID